PLRSSGRHARSGDRERARRRSHGSGRAGPPAVQEPGRVRPGLDEGRRPDGVGGLVPRERPTLVDRTLTGRRSKLCYARCPKNARTRATHAAANASVMTVWKGALVAVPEYVKMKSTHTRYAAARCSHRHPRPRARCEASFDVAAIAPSATKPAPP